ncbi:hypothetical protein [Caenispirillum bisanense]|uniref:hypothetical protein n=1 Tax=Caenispirillum bisanense TaxID=414052 RepID=UPI0031E2A3E5
MPPAAAVAALALLIAAALGPPPAGAADDEAAAAAFTCFMAYGEAQSAARSDAGRRLPAEAARRLSRHIDALGLTAAERDAAVATARGRYLAARPDDLRRDCDRLLKALPPTNG